MAIWNSEALQKKAQDNAGAKSIVISRGDPIFILWLCKLTGSTSDLYTNNIDNDKITSNNLNEMQGAVLSPVRLHDQLKDVQKDITWLKTGAATLIIGLVVLVLERIIQ